MPAAPRDDPDTFALVQSTKTLGCFQIESPGQRELVGKFAPETFEDLIVDISLFRPGPVKSDMITPYLRRRAALERLRAALRRPRNGGLVLVGRRQLRSNNSWMHNLPALVKGKERCTMQVHPEDAERLGLEDGRHALLRSAAGELEAPVEITDAIMPGVVSIPHGWGHDAPGARLSVAADHAGVNSNLLADESMVEPLSGNAILNGIPVEVAPA